MAIFLLWFSIFSFTVFSIALIVCVYRFVRSRQAIQGVYLIIVAVFDLWLLTFTYVFFTDVYLRPLSPGQRLTLGLIRAGVSALILFLYGELALHVGGRRGSRPSTAGRALLLIAPVAYIAVIVLTLGRLGAVTAGIVTVLYYLYLASLGVYANLALKRGRIPLPENLRVFLRFSTVAFAVMIVSVLAYFLDDAASVFSVFPRAGLCLAWGILEIAVFLRRGVLAERSDGLMHPDFLQDYGITPREAEVVALVGEGLTIRGIGERMFVSEKTVETHLYNIYRKCSCRNRVELTNIVRRYRSPG